MRQAVASNRTAPMDILLKLLEDQNDKVRRAATEQLMERKDTPEHIKAMIAPSQ